MKRLEHLPQMAQRQLGGLEATPVILAKAKLQAAEMRSPYRSGAVLRPVLAVCCALVLCIGAVAAFQPSGEPGGAIPEPANVLDSHSAGTQITPTEEPRSLGDVPSGAISMSAGLLRSSGTLFAELGNSTFPLITLDGATYRLLNSPDAISTSLLGEELGSVSEFNVEPALGSGSVVSNAVARGGIGGGFCVFVADTDDLEAVRAVLHRGNVSEIGHHTGADQ